MPVPEDVAAAYELIFNTEKALAEEYIALVTQYNLDIQALVDELPTNMISSPILQAVNQARAMVTSYSGSISNLRTVYKITDPSAPGTTPTFPTPSMNGDTPVADSTV